MRKTGTWGKNTDGPYVLKFVVLGLRPMETLTVKMTWNAFTELRDKHPSRVLDEMNADLFLCTDSSVTFHLPASALNEITYTQIY